MKGRDVQGARLESTEAVVGRGSSFKVFRDVRIQLVNKTVMFPSCGLTLDFHMLFISFKIFLLF